MNDPFFTKKECCRCQSGLSSRIQSWFTEEVICMKCSNLEKEVRKKLPNNGSDFEGCGYIPAVYQDNEPEVSVGEEYLPGMWFYDTRNNEWYRVQRPSVKEAGEISEREANERGIFRIP